MSDPRLAELRRELARHGVSPAVIERFVPADTQIWDAETMQQELEAVHGARLPKTGFLEVALLLGAAIVALVLWLLV